tara:strand:+ start:2260 stop:2934 length:675 start_codon:yes stop_codon:yes gene_type:complete
MKLIKDNWKPQICNSNKEFPYLIVDNWYNKEEEKLIWKEIDFFTATGRDNLKRAEQSETTATKNNKPLARSYRIYLEEIFQPNTIVQNSFIYKFLYKQRSKKFHDLLYKAMPHHANSFQLTNRDSTILSYYEGGDYYHEHIDLFNFTCLIWFHKNPKKYTGGDFYLPGPNKTIESKHNRLLIMPSYYKHGVTKLKMNNKLKIGSGRYTITHFYYNHPFVEVKND